MNLLLLRFPNGKNKAFTVSYDDGCANDKRLAELFRKYNIKGTFNLVTKWGYNKDIYSGFEVAAHGYSHIPVDHIHGTALVQEILKNREALEKDFGEIIRGFAYPGGGYSQEGEDTLRALDFSYARKVNENEWFELPQNFYQWNPTCHQTDTRLFELCDRFNNYNKNARAALFFVWGHSYEFKTDEDWLRMEEMCRRVAGKDDVWYATNIEICDYCQAFSRLKYSADGSIVYNPSSIDLWFYTGSQTLCVKAGQTVKIDEE